MRTTPLRPWSQGNLVRRRDELQRISETFEYDPLDRLTKATVGTSVTTTTYSPNGNIKTFVGPGQSSVNWAYNSGSAHAVTTAYRNGLSHSYTYDGLGRQISRDGQAVSYTSFNKPKRFGTAGSGNPYTDLTYDAAGNRVTKAVSQGMGAGQTLYVHQLYERFTSTNNQPFVRFFVQNLERTFATITYNRAIPPGSPWQRSTVYTHPDHVGSPVLLTDDAGQILERRSYDAFGSRRSPTNWSSAAPGTPEALQVSGFTEHEDEEELGLVNMQGRLYDPLSARFLTPDPLVQAPFFSQSWNRYSYVFNNPLRFTDPSGFEGVPPASINDEPAPQLGGHIGASPCEEPPPTPTGTPFVADNARDPFGGSGRVGDSPPVNIGGGSVPTHSSRAAMSPLQRYALDNYGSAADDRDLKKIQDFYTGVAAGASVAAFAIPLAAGATLGEAAAIVGSSAVRVFGSVLPLARAAAPTASRTSGPSWVAKQVAALGCLAGGPCSCFAAGTIVWTIDGPLPIETIQVGKQILSRDPETGEYSWQPVTKVFITPEKDVYDLQLILSNGAVQILQVTPEHPFWVEYRGWVPAAVLQEGDHVSTADASGWASVQTMRGPPRKTTVYNFEVESTHSYFVGESAVWVHNGPCDHIVLGLARYGLDKVAAIVGGRTLMSDPNWRNTLVVALQDPAAKFTVSLDGMTAAEGAAPTVYNVVMRAAIQGAGRSPSPTNWEMAMLYQYRRLADVTFLLDGVEQANPFK